MSIVGIIEQLARTGAIQAVRRGIEGHSLQILGVAVACGVVLTIVTALTQKPLTKEEREAEETLALLDRIESDQSAARFFHAVATVLWWLIILAVVIAVLGWIS